MPCSMDRRHPRRQAEKSSAEWEGLAVLVVGEGLAKGEGVPLKAAGSFPPNLNLGEGVDWEGQVVAGGAADDLFCAP